MPNTVSVKIRIDDEGSFKKVQVDANDLRQAVGEVTREAERLKASVVNWAEAARAADLFGDAVNQLHGIMKGLTDAYSAQSVAETRLAQAMRNTMGASDAEIESIKQLCSAQQQLGIVGDEVQLEAAQELATYLEFSSSLKTIIPVMNDMIAQQLSLGASAESATTIATMLGKVMNGQTEALSRYGYKFDDAQKYILKFGDEEERAAVLAQVVEESVAGMNEALAATPSGKIQQAANAIGDIKERLGAVVKDIMPFVSGLAEITLAATGIIKLVTTFKSLAAAFNLAKVQSMGLAAAERLQATAARILGVSTLAAKTATGALKAEIIATEAALTLGFSLAVSALVELLSRLVGKSRQASSEMQSASSAMEAYRNAAADARAETAKDIVELEDLIKQKKKEGEKVDELNGKYGAVLGTYSSAADWYDVLISKSKEYCQQLAYEAMAAEYKDELAEALKAQEAADERVKKAMGATGNIGKVTRERRMAMAAYDEASAKVDEITEKMSNASKKAAKIAKSLRAGLDDSGKSWQNMSLADLEKAIQTQKALVESLAGTKGNSAAARDAYSLLASMEARAARLKKLYGLDTSGNTDKDKFDGTSLIKTAKSYQEISNNVKYYQKELEKLDTTDEHYWAKRRQIQGEMNAWQMSLDYYFDDLSDIMSELQSTAVYDEVDEYLGKLNDDFYKLSKYEWGRNLLTTFDDLDGAIAYYTEKQRKANAEDAEGIQRTIIGLQRQKDAMERIARIPQLQQELADLNGLGKRELRVEIQAIGIDGFRDKIKELNRMLDDFEHPITDSQRKEIESLIDTYRVYQRQLVMSFDTFRDGWNSIQGIGNAIKSVTDALEGNGTAWEKVSAVVNAFISLFEAVEGMVAVINMLTEASQAHTAAKGIEAGAEAAEATTRSATAASNAAAAGAEAAANKVATVTWLELAKAINFATYASIPYVGPVLAEGYNASMMASIMATKAAAAFANGGVVYGPTLALMGEYAGASSNPEVIAPLDKLKSLLDLSGDRIKGPIELRARGRDLVAVLNYENNIRRRS